MNNRMTVSQRRTLIALTLVLLVTLALVTLLLVEVRYRNNLDSINNAVEIEQTARARQ